MRWKRGEMKRERERRKEVYFFKKMFQDPQTRQMNQPNMFRKKKKKPSDELFLHFSFESSESGRFFNYFHDSNSFCWAQRIKSELFFGRTVQTHVRITNFCWSNWKITWVGKISRKDGCVVPQRDMRKKCVERNCELVNKRTEQLHKVSTPSLDDHNFKKEELDTVGELSNVCSQVVLKCPYLARIGGPDILWSVNKLVRAVTKWTRACDKRMAQESGATLQQSFKSLLGWPSCQAGGTRISWSIVRSLLTNCLKMQKNWHELVDLTFFG